jgi:AhpD family alkylhydroperoxidase
VNQDAAKNTMAEGTKATDTGWRRFKQLAPQSYAQLLALSAAAPAHGLSPQLIELVKVLCSHINGCTFCVDMHSKAAQAHGASPEQLEQLAAWPYGTAFDTKQNAALQWAQAITLLKPETPWPALRTAMLEHYTAQELVNLSVAITTINAWNRLAIAHGF